MTDSEFILVDTNVIVDVVEQDDHWTDWSCERMTEWTGRMMVNPIVFAELCYEAQDEADVDVVLLSLGLKYSEIPRRALFLAAQAFRMYRQRGGVKTSPLPDFFIGAHAAVLNVPLLTRDVSRYQTYFPDVKLVCPD